jgi:hypothetical protein
MNVDVYKSRSYDEAFGVEDLGIGVLDFAGGIDGGDFAVGEQKIAWGVDAAGRVDEVSVADEDGFHRDLFSFALPAIAR